VHAGGLVDTTYEYGAAVIVLALLALSRLARGGRTVLAEAARPADV
jgi:hypothetical protein